MSASDELRKIGEDIHWSSDRPTTYNRPLAGAVQLAHAFDELLSVVEAAEAYPCWDDAERLLTALTEKLKGAA